MRDEPPDGDSLWHIVLAAVAFVAISIGGQWLSCWNIPDAKVCQFLGLP